MIKVYVFVTGLVLYQIPATPGGSSYAVLASGGYEYPGLAQIASHEVTAFWGQPTGPQTVALPLEATLKVPCPDGGCGSTVPPEGIQDLAKLLVDRVDPPRIQAECLAFGKGTACHPPGLPGVSGRNGLLRFEGGWSVVGMSDCGGNSFPSTDIGFAKLNFVRAGHAWQLRFDGGNVPDAGSTVLFTTTVASMDELEVSSPMLAGYLEAGRTDECSGFPSFEASGAETCAVVVIRNGSTDTYHGGGDLHYAALFALLENPPDPADLWLPIGTGHEVCNSGGGGTGGLSHCTGGFVAGN